MWEFSVITSKQDILALTKLELKIKNKFKNELGICSIFQKENSCTLLLAYEDSKKPELIGILRNELTSFIIEKYKSNLLKNNLNVSGLSKLKQKALLKSLLYFDREYDEEYIKNKLSYINGIHINSFFNFKLKPLKLKWLEICDITNGNIELLNSSDAFYEILQFLVSSLGFKRKIINVIYSEKYYGIYDEKENLICNLKEDSSENFISALISLRAENVNIYSDEMLPAEVLVIINKIYCNKVSLYSRGDFQNKKTVDN